MKNKKIVIGISGDSATGKTALAELIKNVFLKDKAILLDGDSDHKWERNDEHWKTYTHLNPEANFLNRQVIDVQNLKNGNEIHRIEYNHATGTFTEPKAIRPKDYIIINGLHTLFLKEMREKLDFKIYIDAEKKLKTFWKIHRDSSCRNQSIDKILNNIERRKNDYEKYILPQSKYADMIVMYFDNFMKNEDLYDKEYQPHTSLKIAVNHSIDLSELIKILSKYGIKANVKLSKSLNKQILIFDYNNFNNKPIPFNEIISKIVLNEVEFDTANSNSLEILVLILFAYIINKKLLEKE